MTASLRASLERLRQCCESEGKVDIKIEDLVLADENDILAALEAIEQDGWVSVKTKMPEKITDDNGSIWFFVTDGEGFDVAIVLGKRFMGHRELDVTHWKLPSPPQEDAK